MKLILKRIAVEFAVLVSSPPFKVSNIVLQAGAAGFTAPSRVLAKVLPNRFPSPSVSFGVDLSIRDITTSNESLESLIFSIVDFVMRTFSS